MVAEHSADWAQGLTVVLAVVREELVLEAVLAAEVVEEVAEEDGEVEAVEAEAEDVEAADKMPAAPTTASTPVLVIGAERSPPTTVRFHSRRKTPF